MHEGVITRFGPDGGTIGRANTNRLVLDDPERTVSRVHAQVVCRDGLYAILDRGSNPLQLNGQPIGSGNEAPLSQGDRLIVGGFELVVSKLEPEGSSIDDSPSSGSAQFGSWTAPTTDDPFADLLEGLVPKAAPKPAPPSGKGIEDNGQFPDPMGLSAPPRKTPSPTCSAEVRQGDIPGRIHTGRTIFPIWSNPRRAPRPTPSTPCSAWTHLPAATRCRCPPWPIPCCNPIRRQPRIHSRP